jgi:hypothetical protein
MSEPQASRNDPTPEERKGDSSFLPVVIAAGIAIVIILVAALIFLKVRQTKAIPKANDPHTTSQIMRQPTALRSDFAAWLLSQQNISPRRSS